MASDLLGVSVTGLRVAQAALSTTGHNISNAGVAGYSRQSVNASTNPANLTGGGYIGSGANVDSITREVNDFISLQLRQDTALSTELSSYLDNISQLDGLLSDASTGLSGAMSSFFASMHNGSDDPTSIPARQLIISEASNLADRFNTVYGRVSDIEEGVNSALSVSVSEINALASSIAQLNQNIASAMGNSSGAIPNDLLDQRDEALRALSEIVSIQTYDQGFGQVNVVIGSGQSLVIGTESRSLSLEQSIENANSLDVVFNGESTSGQIITDYISGGELGGTLRFRDNVLSDTYNELGRIAVVIADTFNTMHESGIDLNDEFGGGFFYDINDIDISANRVIGSSSNSVSPERVVLVNIADSTQITPNNYTMKVDDGGLFRVTRDSDGEEVSTGLLTGEYPFSVEFEGLELVFESGTFATGDEFSLQSVRNGARDFDAIIEDPESIAFGNPVQTDSSIGNEGTGQMSSGEVLSLVDENGESLPLFGTTGEMNPPLIVRFTSDNIYDVLDNSDPANPVQLEPPIRNQKFIPGINNALFPTDSNETQITTQGDFIGLSDGRYPTVGGGDVNNGYPAEVINFSRPSSVAGASPTVERVITGLHASAKETATLLNNISGVTATASNYIELSDIGSLSLTEPLQISLNGEELIEYEFNTATSVVALSSSVPDPAVSADAFNDYLAERINENPDFQSAGIYAIAGTNAVTGESELRVYATQGDDFDVVLTADNTTPDSLSISDGTNPSLALDGNGAGITSAITIGGSLDVKLSDGLSVSTLPPDSLLFGDTSADDFAESTFLGIQVSLSGTPKIGDTFTIDFNANAASDNRNALALANLETEKTMNNGVTSFSDGYGVLVETIGISTSSAQINSNAASEVLEQSQQLRDSVSGVNLDEEAANLIRFEQMYTANTQVINVARQIFDALINSF